MPEGPTIVLLKEEVLPFTGQKVTDVYGNSKIEQDRLLNQKVIAFESWGKHFLICFKGFTVRVHFLLFGSFRINEKKGTPERLHLGFKKGELNLFTCAIKILEGSIDDHYDWSTDVMRDEWDPKKARAKLRAHPEMMICDALLEQEIFAGVGNIIKNEVLYRIRIHPESLVGKLSPYKINQVIEQARFYSFEFLEWKRAFVLKKHWLAHNKKMCSRCQLPFLRKHTGLKKRRSFICANCQKLYI